MDYYGSSIGRLIGSLKSLPGIGEKSAQRLAFHIISMPEEEVKSIADSLVEARRSVHFCKYCGTLTDDEIVSAMNKVLEGLASMNIELRS